jgi:PAS domain S-box-containing protein
VASELERQLQGLRPGAHLCHICDGPADAQAALVPFFHAGLAGAERCLYIATSPNAQLLVQGLRSAGIDVDQARRQEALLLLTPEETYLRWLPFNPPRVVGLFRNLMDHARAAGFAGLRGAGDMTWALDSTVAAESLFQYATLLNQFLAESGARALCHYARPKCRSDVLHGLLRTHPLVLVGDHVCPNVYYEPPDLTVAPDPLGRRADWMLDQLERARAEEREHLRLLEQLHQERSALRVSEYRYRLLFERNLAAVYRSTLDGELLDCNEAFAHILGYTSRSELMSQKASDFYVSPEDRTAFLVALQQSGALTNHEMRMRRKDGRPIWVLINTSLLRESANRSLLEGTFVDISARKDAEEATVLDATRYRSLIDTLGQGICLKDRELRCVLVNKAFCDTLGRPEAEITGRSDTELFPRAVAEALQADDRRVLSRGERREREETLTLDGKPHTLRVIKTPVQNDDGAIVGVLGIFWDVTEQRNLEAQLRQAQKMEAIGLMAGGIAHDFNNLLSVILGNIALSLGGLSETHAHRELLLAAERAGVQAAELTNQLLGFARQTILRPVPVHLQVCMEEAVRLLRRTIDPRIALEVKPAGSLWTVEADPGQINQVLMNLCLNARDAMPEGGRLVLEAVNIVIDDDLVRKHVEARRGEYVRLRVSDTGCGIPPEIRARIFEPFFTTKSAGKGTGLGLAMVFGIVTQHHGWIECHSEVGHGTRFDIYLPRHAWTAPAAGVPTAKPTPRGGQETILLADDEPMIRTLGRTILQRYGYRVLLAEDGVEAVDIYRQSRDDIALVILDLTMPRLSGHDALHQLLQINPEVQVLLASGYSAEHLLEHHNERIAGFLNKPYRPEMLATAVREVLDRIKNGAAN